MLPLTKASLLPDYILGAAIESVALNDLLSTHAGDITKELGATSSSEATEEYAEQLFQRLNQQGVKMDTLQVAEAYTDSEANRKNIHTWMGALSLGEARGRIVPVRQCSHSPESESSSGAKF